MAIGNPNRRGEQNCCVLTAKEFGLQASKESENDGDIEHDQHQMSNSEFCSIGTRPRLTALQVFRLFLS